jgi:hypothetical protein
MLRTHGDEWFYDQEISRILQNLKVISAVVNTAACP